MQTIESLRMTVMASLFAALIAAGAFLAIPVGPVPIYLANFFVLLVGLVLGCRWGLAAVAVYLLAGMLGLPVFSGGTGGLGRIFGPTGGYLLAYVPAVLTAGWISDQTRPSVIRDVFAMLVATGVIYGIGVPWLKIISGMTWGKSVAVGILPFLIGDGIKIAAAVPVARMVRPLVQRSGLSNNTAVSVGPNGSSMYEHH